MKFRVFGILLAAVLLLSCGFSAMGEQGAASVAETVSEESAADMVLVTRLENMLNHNRVYNGDFTDSTVIINRSVAALCDRADEDGYLKRELVLGFVYNMYGIGLEGYKSDERFPEKEGYIFVVPSGYDVYSHKVVATETNGNYLYATSEMTLTAHDGYAYEFTCRSVFKVNENSAFGYNLISSNYY